jgi:hypothetical protein
VRKLKNRGSEMEKLVNRLCTFLPPDVKIGVVNLLLENYNDKKSLAGDISCSPSSLRAWSKGRGKPPSDKYMPKILSLALKRCPNVKSLLRTRVLSEVNHLCADIGVSKDAENLGLSGLMEAMDEKSREIIWYVLRNRHADIGELSKLIDASTDMEVLFRIREVINPKADRILGKPLLRFEECRIDPVSGEKTLFSWWLEEGVSLIEEDGKPLMDVFDEGSHVRIIAEVPNSVEVIGSTYKNGVLEIELEKVWEKR